MKHIAVISTTRAEFGLLLPLIKELRTNETEEFRVSLVVTGTHLSDEYGGTISEIKETSLRIDEEIPVRMKSCTPEDISRNQADVLVKFTKLFSERKYDAIVILGDRYEMLMIAIAATNTLTPIIHLCGGDTTEGAVDECVRHSITKMSYYHFVTNELSKRRVIQLGENPERVFNVGSTSIDNINGIEMYTSREVLASLGINCAHKYAVCTYHPVTLEAQDLEETIMDFVGSIKKKPEIEFIVTKSNADIGGTIINEILERESRHIRNMHIVDSLGMARYIALVRRAEFVMGNSSSGIIEAPALHVPTINIGDRQKGRLKSESVINCGTKTHEINSAIEMALSEKMKEIAQSVISPYGDGHAAPKMAKLIFDLLHREIDVKKSFYDIKMGDTRSE